MSHSIEDLQYSLDSLSDDEATGLRSLLARAHDSGNFQAEEDWAQLCEFFISRDREVRASLPFWNRYRDAAQHGVANVHQAMRADLHDNYALAAACMIETNLDPAMPVVAWAAYNRHCYPGLNLEFSVIRFLCWAGFDINGADEASGCTALHYLAQLRYAPGSHVWGVRWLLEHGAEVNAQNSLGDTPLTYLAGTTPWKPAMTETAELLLAAGADPFIQSKDGSNSLTTLLAADQRDPDQGRQRVIAQIQAMAGKEAVMVEKDHVQEHLEASPAPTEAEKNLMEMGMMRGFTKDGLEVKISLGPVGSGESQEMQREAAHQPVLQSVLTSGEDFSAAFAQGAGFFTKMLHKRLSPAEQRTFERDWVVKARNKAATTAR